LEKYGEGALLLNGANTYTGETTVREGVLGGTGTIGNVRIAQAATLAPGLSLGVFHIGDATFEFGSTLALEFASPTLADRLEVTGTVTIDSEAQLALALGYAVTGPDTFTILLNDGADPINGNFTVGAEALTEGKTFAAAGASWTISYTGGSGNDITLTVVPEPTAAVTLLSGLGVLLLHSRRRRQHRKQLRTILFR
jgi:fibronectin-binding autotransporter adhesin